MAATPIPAADLSGELDDTPAKHHPYRWRLHRAGIVNVWRYLDNEFAFSGGRMILRGTNGSGKSRALEMLLPFLLDADRRKMDATGAGKVRLEDLMKAGIGADAKNRLGYLWLELARTRTDEEIATDPNLDETAYLTVGALVRFSTNTAEAKPWYFTTELRVGTDLILLGTDRHPLSREHLAELIGSDRITDSPETHRERVRTDVFGLHGTLGKERFTGLVQLLHTLRSPDVGNRINEGKLPQILSDALPPLSELTLKDAGERLDGLSETRAQQRRMEQALKQIQQFCDVYRRYAAAALHASASSTSRAARAARATRREATDALAKHGRLVEEHALGAAQVLELEGHVTELFATITGIKASSEYRAGRDLDLLERRVDGLAAAATAALAAAGTARTAEAGLIEHLDRDAADVATLAADVAAHLDATRDLLHQADVPTGSLPDTISADLSDDAPVVEPIRAARDADPQPLPRPVPQVLTVTPEHLPAALASVRDIESSAQNRTRQASVRLAAARDLAEDWQKVGKADEKAEAEEARLEEDQSLAEIAEDERDTAARHLATTWRDWTADTTTVDLLGEVNWTSTPVARLLVDLDALIGDIPDADGSQEPSAGVPAVPILDDLDRVARDVAMARLNLLVLDEAALDAEEKTGQAMRQDLDREKQQLEAAVDPVPDRAPWTTAAPADAVPLWKAIDFATDTSPAEQAGLEAALLASGLLSAVITTDGTVVADNGQLLVTAAAPAAPSPVTAHLVADPAAPLDAATITAVLERINAGPGHTTWVGVDGQWGNGPLRGAHTGPAARHIGATARATARADRLAAIAVQLAELDTKAEARTQRRAEITTTRALVTGHVRTAPTSTELRKVRTIAAVAGARVAKTAAQARDARQAAARLRTKWATADATHRSICDAQALPYDTGALSAVQSTTSDAARATARLAEEVGRLHTAQERWAGQHPALDAARQRRREAEEHAEQEHARYAGEHAEFAALKDAVGRQAEEVRQRLKDAEENHRLSTAQLKTLRDKVVDLGQQAAAAAVTTAGLAQAATEEQERMTRTATVLVNQLAVPGVHAAASTDGTAVPTPTGLLTDASVVDAFAKAVLSGLDERGAAVDDTALVRATTTLTTDLAGSFDVVQTVADSGLHLVELAGEGDRQPVAVAAAALARKVEEDARALTAREHEVFTKFVLGGVGDELGRRIDQANKLIAAMNASLGSIRTSHGIGVKLRWDLADSSGTAITRIRQLVSTTTAIRRTEDNDELIALLRQRVEEQLHLDESAGYAAHLRTALDYREWHHVDVIITGPEPGRERRISVRAKLSQGEIRFVSYVTLFAAADAYLSGLQDNERALRLILLDDAFAKVDERTIGELMGLLVKLDIDFAMTGHGLWGMFPQVPAIDVYEVRRVEGSSAVTTRVHWDGRNRHLRPAT